MAMDRCCRQHDLCPIKIRAYQNKYELMNDSLYTKWVKKVVGSGSVFGIPKNITLNYIPTGNVYNNDISTFKDKTKAFIILRC